MAAALGFLTGAGLSGLAGYAAEKTQQKHQHEAQWDQFLTTNIMQNPEVAGTPQGQKELKRMFGEHADAAGAMLNLAAQHKQQFAQDVQGAMGGGQPQAGGPQQVAGANQAGAPSGMDRVEMLRSEMTRFQAMRTKYMNDPQASQFINQHITDLEKEIGSVQHDAEFQQNQAGLKEQRDATNALRQQGLAIQQENARAMQGIAAMNADTHATIAQLNASIAQGKAKEDTQKNFDTAKNALQKQFNAIVKAKTGTSTVPGMNAQQLKPMIDSYNKQAKTLADRAKKSGVDYDSDEFQPLKAEDITSHPWYSVGPVGASTTTELGNATDSPSNMPTATNDKGEKIQWDGKAWTPVK